MGFLKGEETKSVGESSGVEPGLVVVLSEVDVVGCGYGGREGDVGMKEREDQGVNQEVQTRNWSNSTSQELES